MNSLTTIANFLGTMALKLYNTNLCTSIPENTVNLWPKTFLIRFNTLNDHNRPSTGNKMVQRFGPLFNFKISD